MDAADTQRIESPDWSVIRAVYMKGLSLAECAARFKVPYGTIRSRAYRENWTADVARANDMVILDATDKLKASAATWIGKIDTLVHASLDSVMQKGVSKLTLRDLTIALDCAEKANRMARLNFGLDADHAHPKVQVNVAIAGSGAPLVHHDILDIDTLRASSVQVQQVQDATG